MIIGVDVKSEQFSSVIINMDVRIIDYQDVVGFAL